MQVVIDDILVNYSVEGDGEVVLLLHGWGDSLTTFDHLVSKLKYNYKVIRLDLPGFGKTETPNTTFNLESYAKFLKKFLQKTSDVKLYAIVGHSNGGAIAIKATANDIVECEKLILLASSGVRSTLSVHKKLMRIFAKTAKIPTKLLPKTYQNKLKRKVYDKIGSDMFIAENMQESFRQIVSEDLVSQARNISIQTLLVYGDKDTATPFSYGQTFHHAINNSRLEILPDVGHFIHRENADRVESLIKEFLR